MYTQSLALALAVSGAVASPLMARQATSQCATDCNNKYDVCRGAPDANRSLCASQYASCLGYSPFSPEGSRITPTACSGTAAQTAAPTPVVTVTAVAAATMTATAAAQGSGWTVKNLIRYCGADASGCDYNFDFSYNDGRPTKHCTIIRTNKPGALTESWYNQPCTDSTLSASWGYSAQFEVPFAVLTVSDSAAKANAYFGVNNPNGQPATVQNPKGSLTVASIGPQPVVAW